MTAAVKPARLYARLRALYARGQLLGLLAGLAALIRWLIVLFLAVLAVDWTVHIPAPGRIAILVLLLAFALYKAWQSGWRHFGPFSPARWAMKAERGGGNLQSLLVTGVQLCERPPSPGTSESLSALAIRQADEAAATLRASAIVPFRELRWRPRWAPSSALWRRSMPRCCAPA